MKHYTLNGNPFTCPENWREVTLEQLLKINTGITRPIETIAICTGIPEIEWNKSTDYALVEELYINLAFLKSLEGFDIEKEPKEIVFNEVKVSQITDIGKLSVVQYEELKLEIDEFHKEEEADIDRIRRLAIYPRIVSIYLQPLITGSEYDYDKAEEIRQQLLKKHSAMEVSEWGSFFIRRYQELRHGILKDVQKGATHPSRPKPGIRSYLKTLVLRRFSIVYPEETLKKQI